MASSTWGQTLDAINPSQAGGEFETLPKGKYDFVIRSTKVGKTRAGDKDKVGLLVVITSGPHAGKKQYNDGTFTWSVDDPDTLARLLGNLAILGISKEWVGQNSTPENLAEVLGQVLVGRTFTCEMEPREFPVGSGNTRMNFGFIEAYKGPPVEETSQTPVTTPQPQAAPAPAPIPAPAPVADAPTPAPAPVPPLVQPDPQVQPAPQAPPNAPF
jgi:hypothetical protein